MGRLSAMGSADSTEETGLRGTDRIEGFTHDGLRFDVLDDGPRDAQDVVVLLHGFPQRATSWAGVAARLHRAGVRTIAPDQRGYSPGARPRRRRDYRIDRLAGDALALLDLVSGDDVAGASRVHLVGHDWGSAVAWLAAAQHPAVRSLTSISVPHPAAYLRSTLTRDQARRSWYVGFFNLPRVPERAAARGDFDRHLLAGGMTQDEVAAVRRDVVDAGALPGGLGWYRAIPVALPIAPRLWSLRVQVPVTHVWSDGDVALGPRTAELASRWADGEFESRTLAGASHWLPEQHPDEIAEIVLDRVSRA